MRDRQRVSIFRRFRVQAIARVLALTLSVAALCALLVKGAELPLIIAVSVLVVYLTWSLVAFVERANRDMSRFLEVIRYADFSQSFTAKGMGPGFDELYRSFAAVLSEFHKSRAEKEAKARTLQTIVEHVGVGLLSFRADGTVDLINNAAKRLLRVAHLPNIRHLKNANPKLVETLLGLESGDRTIIPFEDSGSPVQLSVRATRFRIQGVESTLVSMQDIHGELEEKEIEAWQNLIRVLTHEIMNSMTPISSMASTAAQLLDGAHGEDGGGAGVGHSEALRDIGEAVRTIQRRSTGLMEFVGSYRNLALIPRPKFRIVPVTELVERVEQLMRARFRERGIRFMKSVNPVSLEITADPDQIEQVLINLLLNAVDAVKEEESPRIDLRARLDERGRVLIDTIDNGCGIVDEAKSKIFIPFFTTKKEGSGIGLSISRQIMRLHRGALIVQSKFGEGSTFTMRF